MVQGKITEADALTPSHPDYRCPHLHHPQSHQATISHINVQTVPLPQNNEIQKYTCISTKTKTFILTESAKRM